MIFKKKSHCFFFQKRYVCEQLINCQNSLEWVSEWSRSVVSWLLATPWTVAYHVLPSMGFSRQEYWSGLPFPSPEDLPDPGIKPGSPTLLADALPRLTTREVLTDSKTALRITICYSSLLRKIRPREVKPVAQGHGTKDYLILLIKCMPLSRWIFSTLGVWGGVMQIHFYEPTRATHSHEGCSLLSQHSGRSWNLTWILILVDNRCQCGVLGIKSTSSSWNTSGPEDAEVNDMDAIKKNHHLHSNWWLTKHSLKTWMIPW